MINHIRLAGLACLVLSSLAYGDPAIISGGPAAPHRGAYEICLAADASSVGSGLEASVQVTFTRPDSSLVTVDAFYDGVMDGQAIYRARAYCGQVGTWSWASSSPITGLDSQAGTFEVHPSTLPGKLRKHPQDSHQFAYDSGEWFLHIGDTGYRYVVDTEPEWQAYIDQAVRMGATKIRVWFCRSRSGVEALFSEDRTALNIPYWQEIDRRVQYALNQYPRCMLQLILFGEDTQELLRYGQGDRMSRLAVQYAQARFSALPNVLWCISNDRRIIHEGEPSHANAVPASVIDAIGRDMASREPWGSLLTNHQVRGSGYAFTAAPWSDVTTLEDLDQVNGAILREYRQKADDPVINDEDRYEMYKPPAYPEYFFRRLMWASLLSGGAATYGGACTYQPYNGRERGVRGYYVLKQEGILTGGADSFTHIHAFFETTSLSLAGMHPADGLAETSAHDAIALAGEKALLVYLPNPDTDAPDKANAAPTAAQCDLRLPSGDWTLRWFCPKTGVWSDAPHAVLSGGDAPHPCVSPLPGDAVMLLLRVK